MKKFGGDGSLKQACRNRRCVVLQELERKHGISENAESKAKQNSTINGAYRPAPGQTSEGNQGSVSCQTSNPPLVGYDRMEDVINDQKDEYDRIKILEQPFFPYDKRQQNPEDSQELFQMLSLFLKMEYDGTCEFNHELRERIKEYHARIEKTRMTFRIGWIEGMEECLGLGRLEPHLLLLCLNSDSFAIADAATLRFICERLGLDQDVRKAVEKWNLSKRYPAIASNESNLLVSNAKLLKCIIFVCRVFHASEVLNEKPDPSLLKLVGQVLQAANEIASKPTKRKSVPGGSEESAKKKSRNMDRKSGHKSKQTPQKLPPGSPSLPNGNGHKGQAGRKERLNPFDACLNAPKEPLNPFGACLKGAKKAPPASSRPHAEKTGGTSENSTKLPATSGKEKPFAQGVARAVPAGENSKLPATPGTAAQGVAYAVAPIAPATPRSAQHPGYHLATARMPNHSHPKRIATPPGQKAANPSSDAKKRELGKGRTLQSPVASTREANRSQTLQSPPTTQAAASDTIAESDSSNTQQERLKALHEEMMKSNEKAREAAAAAERHREKARRLRAEADEEEARAIQHEEASKRYRAKAVACTKKTLEELTSNQ